MKKILTLTALTLLAIGGMNAQNTFRGIVKYKIESTGKVDVQLNPEATTFELKVYDDNLLVEASQALQNGLRVTQATDLSQLIGYLAANDITLDSYDGDGKILIRQNTTKEEIDSLEIKDDEPGHYYLEYTSETKEILGFTANKMIMHIYDMEGQDSPVECWYTTQMGPEYCLLIGPIKGIPLVYTSQLGDGKAITYTATEIVKGKVKEVDMLLPAGYKQLSEEEMETLQQELQDAFELLED